MTVREYTVLTCNQPIGLTQPSTLSGTGYEYRQGTVVVIWGWEGNRRSGVAPAMHLKLCGILLNGLQYKEGRLTSRLHSSEEYDTLLPYTLYDIKQQYTVVSSRVS